MEKTKVLYYNSTLQKGGTDTYMVGVVKNLDKEKFIVDVIVKEGDAIDKSMLKDLENDGHNVFLAHGSFLKRMLFLKNFFKKHKSKYDVIHINATSQGVGIISYFASHYGKIKKIIFHSHMGGSDHKKDFVDKIGDKLLKKHSTIFASCSNAASNYMFGEKFCKTHNVIKLNNSVDTDVFCFSAQTRDDTRKELNIDSKDFVILHIGRFAPQKNHKKLIEIFDFVSKHSDNTKLILIGNGPLFEETKSQIESLGLTKKVLLLGEQSDVSKYMQAADCFVMPSIHEGLPIVAVEAQATGLPLVLSDNISRETKLTDNVVYLGLDEPLENWTKTIMQFNNQNRHSNKDILKEKGFDKNTAIKEIEKLYLE